MKKLLLFAVVYLFSAALTQGQGVLYACDKTGAWGAGYNNDNAPTTEQECVNVAISGCKNHGGTNCTLLYKSNKAGWWGFVSGKTASGLIFFQGIDGCASKAVAENTVREKYKAQGGIQANDIKVYTWYVYNNPK